MPTEPLTGSRIPGVLLHHPRVHGDDRGRFVEIFRAAAMPEPFVQCNHSRSAAGVLRGLHYHTGQADLWYLAAGRAQVGLVDLRPGGGDPVVETFELDGERPASLYIPRGVAHGYLALTPIDMIYWVTSEYNPADEHGLAWDDPQLGIEWQLAEPPVVSARDAANPTLSWAAIPSFA
jgi:dTDP-4-dehydrorhamnose 3,5-epimerase